MRIDLETYCVCRALLAEKMQSNPSDEKYKKAHEKLRAAFEQESERETNQDQLPMLLRRQAGGF